MISAARSIADVHFMHSRNTKLSFRLSTAVDNLVCNYFPFSHRFSRRYRCGL